MLITMIVVMMDSAYGEPPSNDRVPNLYTPCGLPPEEVRRHLGKELAPLAVGLCRRRLGMPTPGIASPRRPVGSLGGAIARQHG